MGAAAVAGGAHSCAQKPHAYDTHVHPRACTGSRGKFQKTCQPKCRVVMFLFFLRLSYTFQAFSMTNVNKKNKSPRYVCFLNRKHHPCLLPGSRCEGHNPGASFPGPRSLCGSHGDWDPGSRDAAAGGARTGGAGLWPHFSLRPSRASLRPAQKGLRCSTNVN